MCIYIYTCARGGSSRIWLDIQYICIFYSTNQVMSKNLRMSYRSILDLGPLISNLQMLSGIYVIYIYIYIKLYQHHLPARQEICWKVLILRMCGCFPGRFKPLPRDHSRAVFWFPGSNDHPTFHALGHCGCYQLRQWISSIRKLRFAIVSHSKLQKSRALKTLASW